MRIAFQKNVRRSAFTLIEIALSLAIIGFALVAVVGVLPKGLSAQRETREQTIINQDVTVWIEALRQSAIGFDYLVDHVETLYVNDEVGPRYYTNGTQVVRGLPGTAPVRALTNGFGIVSRMTKPTYDIEAPFSFDHPHTNVVSATVRALTGASVEQDSLSADSSMAFRYQVTAEMVPFMFFANQATNGMPGFPPIAPGVIEDPAARFAEAPVLANNCFELRLKFEWPVVNGRVGPNSKVYRTIVTGSFRSLGIGASGEQVRYFVPDTFTPTN